MFKAPVYEIDPLEFWNDPYPDLKAMRAKAPVAYVPQFDATLLTLRNDIFENEKKIDVFSSVQPDGLMTRLMGQNLMRKDGQAHQLERKAIFPTMSPKTVKNVWRARFEYFTHAILDALVPKKQCDLVKEFSMPVSAEALKLMTGLTNMSNEEMNRVSQGMIDGCANYSGDPDVEAECRECTESIEIHAEDMAAKTEKVGEFTLLSVQPKAGISLKQTVANIKLAISGGLNEPRDAIAGTVWALLGHPQQLATIHEGEATWMQAFEEYARWISPIGMSPRRVAKPYELRGSRLEAEDRVFLMFGSGNRDETVFDAPDEFDIKRDNGPSIPFGAGPHFCAGAWASRCLVAEVALPALFARLENLRLQKNRETVFGGWAFRGPTSVHVEWDCQT